MENSQEENETENTIEIDSEELQNILQDSFNTIELLEEQMAQITNEFENIDDTKNDQPNIESETNEEK